MEKIHILYSRLISQAEDHEKSVNMDNQIALCNMQKIYNIRTVM